MMVFDLVLVHDDILRMWDLYSCSVSISAGIVLVVALLVELVKKVVCCSTSVIVTLDDSD